MGLMGKHLRIGLSALALAALSPLALAATPGDNPRTDPVLRDCAGMPGPRVDIRDHQEGWVDVRFTVKADGSVADAVVAGAHAAAGERLTTALSVASRCQFTPGTLKGAPADTLNQTRRVFFQMDPPDKATDFELVKRFKDVRDYLEKGAFEKAADTLDRIEGQSSNLYEISQVLSRRAALAVRQGQPVLGLMYLRQVVPNADYMAADERQALLRLRLQLELDLGLPVDAARTAALIADLGRQNGDKPLLDRLAALEKTVAGNAAFGVQGRLPQQCPADLCAGGRVEWVYRPSNRTISLANIQGSLDKVTARCQGKTYEARAEAGVSWTIPASWGDCSVAVSGQPGSSFQLVDEKLPPA
ncbi:MULTISPECIES: hypothetical protein [unclassified Azospirillum]|uniref:hypothetical protein n=1 Tax=unclassified Azospirillum TaxID=2630922 RepID=UPI000B636271|nr:MULTISPECIES: hypothetical protein [unclassified Azospirillum]SNS78595.1 hypothetical protein SAMN05880556_111138 [Azospirillum sp. RU38E]SNS95838.1 hypothetical protein SAMN05880591_111138 [Azospirillum sp. RU37A]